MNQRGKSHPILNALPFLNLLIVSLIVLQIACKDTQIKQAARASDDMATTISLAIDAKRALATSNPPLITPQEELALTLGLQKVNAAVRAFNEEVKRLSKVDPNSKGQLLALFADITKSISDLNAQGVLGIKNPDSKAKLTVILAGFNASITAIQVALGGV